MNFNSFTACTAALEAVYVKKETLSTQALTVLQIQ